MKKPRFHVEFLFEKNPNFLFILSIWLCLFISLLKIKKNVRAIKYYNFNILVHFEIVKPLLK